MPHILQLDPHVADLIAAGEVVERPASVVKELMENAIDAGADALTVEIQHGGMSLIRVTDNGCGIAAAEVETAFLRHATSKLRTEYDLEAIGTLGFRGGSGGHLRRLPHRLLTRTAGGGFGGRPLPGGRRGGAPGGGRLPQGTTMVVRDLFYNTPARLKFLKKDAAEGGGLLRHGAAGGPVPPGGERQVPPGRQAGAAHPRRRAGAVGPLRRAGPGYGPGLHAGEGLGEDMSVSGFVSLPTCCRGTRGYQHFSSTAGM